MYRYRDKINEMMRTFGVFDSMLMTENTTVTTIWELLRLGVSN
jgi:hypothetical protein